MSHASAYNHLGQIQTDKIAILKDRAHMLSQVRRFFTDRHVLEVDCPALSFSAAIDVNIDLISAQYAQTQMCYLHSSPEYGMKRLLSAGIGDIYQLSHVFRDEEWGKKHNPEFMMTEWYRCGISFDAFINETAEFVALFIGNMPLRIISYRDALLQYAAIDYLTASVQELYQRILDTGIFPHFKLEEKERENMLNLLLATFVEPELGQNELTALIHYPASQAALATIITKDSERVAERFELYFQGVELANGYHELAQAKEQRSRFEEANKQRQAIGKKPLPLDENFLGALQQGLPDCCGVAVGFDRLMMLRHKQTDIARIIPFGWTEV